MPARRTISARPMTAAIAISLLAAIGAAGAMTASQNVLNDVQVGEKDSLMRIALVCEKGCNVKSLSEASFEISNVDSDLEIPLNGRSKLASMLKIEPGEQGSVLSIVTDGLIARAKINDCAVRDAVASCIDLAFYDGPIAAEPQAQTSTTKITNPQPAPASPPSQKPLADAAKETLDNIPEFVPAKQASVERPALRQAPNRDMLTFARFNAPERLAPPKLAALTPVRTEGFEVPAPSLASDVRVQTAPEPQPKILQRPFSLKEQAKTILGKPLDVGDCEGAQARLNRDAWALDAMIDVGFCKAASGDLEEADRLFTRLLAYTPDNYEALVGRALIAIEHGEQSDARKYFQDALNALPPIEESDLIVEAMRRL